MRRKLLLFLILSFSLVSCESSLTLNPDDLDSNNGPKKNRQSTDDPNFPNLKINPFEKEIFFLVNNHRALNGKVQLKWHEQGIIESQDHAQAMAAFRAPFSHAGHSLRYARIKAKDPDPFYKFGENIAKNSTAKRAFNAWMLSPGHRANIEGNFTHIGIGASKSASGPWYFNQIFLKK